MTRETKIGLLVGLAFIILIGILLSDHLSVSTQPPQAALVQAGESVREGITVPGGPSHPVATPAVPSEIHPNQRVPMRQDLHAPRPEDTIVSIVPGSQNRQEAPVSIRYYGQQQAPNTLPPGQYQVVTPEQVVGVTPPAQPYDLPEQPAPQLPVMTETPGIHPDLPPTLQRLAQHEELVVVDQRGMQQQTTPRDNRTPVQAREYVAKPGDSLSKIAARFYGRSTPESRDLLVKANPSLKDNPNLIIAGRTYLIPERSITDAPAIPASNTTPAAPRASSNGNNLYVYTVKSGDSLWKIANEMLGDPAEVKTIKSLNQDVLKGSDVVRVGMKLRLPGQPVASAS